MTSTLFLKEKNETQMMSPLCHPTGRILQVDILE